MVGTGTDIVCCEGKVYLTLDISGTSTAHGPTQRDSLPALAMETKHHILVRVASLQGHWLSKKSIDNKLPSN
jgi:hypothetical protein